MKTLLAKLTTGLIATTIAFGGLLAASAPANAVGADLETISSLNVSTKVSTFKYHVRITKVGTTPAKTHFCDHSVYYNKYTLKALNSTNTVIYTTTVTYKNAAVLADQAYSLSKHKFASQATFLAAVKKIAHPTGAYLTQTNHYWTNCKY